MNDGESEHDPEPKQPKTVTGRQKARAAVSQLHPPEILAKLCTGFKGANIKIVVSVLDEYAALLGMIMPLEIVAEILCFNKV